jgi:hypothetical protein
MQVSSFASDPHWSVWSTPVVTAETKHSTRRHGDTHIITPPGQPCCTYIYTTGERRSRHSAGRPGHALPFGTARETRSATAPFHSQRHMCMNATPLPSRPCRSTTRNPGYYWRLSFCSITLSIPKCMYSVSIYSYKDFASLSGQNSASSTFP